MFSGLGYIQPNERGEYEIAEGTSAATFRAILEYYQGCTFYYLYESFFRWLHQDL